MGIFIRMKPSQVFVAIFQALIGAAAISIQNKLVFAVDSIMIATNWRESSYQHKFISLFALQAILIRKMPGQGGRIRLPSLGTESNSSAAAQLQKEHHRVVMMGSAKVGKSSIISQFLYDKYLSRYKETVEELHR